MADCYGAAVDVEFVAFEAELAFDADDLRAEGFVDLEAIDGVELQACAVEEFADRGRGSDAHDLRGYADCGDGDDARERLDITRFCVCAGADQRRCGAVHDGGTVAAGLYAVEGWAN